MRIILWLAVSAALYGGGFDGVAMQQEAQARQRQKAQQEQPQKHEPVGYAERADYQQRLDVLTKQGAPK